MGEPEADGTALLQVAGRTVEVVRGQRLHLALLRAGIMVETPCGSRGKCRKCRVRVGEGSWPVSDAERDQLSAEELSAGYRLSCQQVVAGGGAVAVMAERLVGSAKTAISRLQLEPALDPWYDRSLRRAGGRALGLAVDVGTTTVVAALLDLDTGEELGGMSVANPQGGYGADLMSRLSYAQAGADALTELQSSVVGAVNELCERLCRRAGAPTSDVLAVTVVGNTAMHHLFFGLPIADLALAPYVPSVKAAMQRQATTVGSGLSVNPRASVYALPNVAGFVGADAVAVMLASGLDQPGPPRMVADIGTNGEIAVAGAIPGGPQRLVCCSAPAGPAFEGGEISQGMRAGPGAIEGVRVVHAADTDIAADIAVDVIAGQPARGICGSGLLDAIAACVESGLIDTGGRIAAGAELERLSPALRARVPDGGVRRVVLADGVALTQQDVRALQLAKGAIRSGMEVALRAFGVPARELKSLSLAGAFGNYLHPQAAVACGLVPDVTLQRLQPIGNAAAQGCKLCLLSDAARRRAERLAARAEHVDLATNPEFEAIFMEALGFPEPARAR